jgi:hypothetical protein
LLDASAAGALPGTSADTDTDKVALMISGKELTVDPWTQGQLKQYSRPDGTSESECTRMVTQSVALLAKCEVDLSNLKSQDQHTTGSLYAAQAQLMLDAAVGQSLVMDIQRVIDDLLTSGRLEEARQLSKFHHQLRNAMFQLRGRIDTMHHSTLQDLANKLSDTESTDDGLSEEGEFAIQVDGMADELEAQTAEEERSSEMPDRPSPRESSPSATQRMAGALASRVSSGRPSARANRPVNRSPSGGSDNGRKVQVMGNSLPTATIPRRTVVLAGLFLLTAAWLVIVISSNLGAAGPGTFRNSDRVTLAGTEGQIEDRWPSMFVTVKTEAWNGLSDRERTRFAQELSNRLSPEGYSGALIRGADGVPLAEWLRGGGVRLLDSGKRPTGRRAVRSRPIDSD